MQKLSITKRIADIGGAIVNRTQMHGKKEKVPAISVPFLGIVLTEDEFCAIMQDAEAYQCFFTNQRSRVWEPRFPGTEPISISDKFEGARVTIDIEDMKDNVVLKPASVGSIIIQCKGAQPIMKCMVSGVPDVHLQTLTMLNKRCRISILNGALADRSDAQKDLPLDGDGPNAAAPAADDGDSEDPTTLAQATDEENEATESAIGRQIRKSEAKKAKGAKPKARTKRDP